MILIIVHLYEVVKWLKEAISEPDVIKNITTINSIINVSDGLLSQISQVGTGSNKITDEDFLSTEKENLIYEIVGSILKKKNEEKRQRTKESVLIIS